MATLNASSQNLPEPTQISSNDEIIWSANTGRSSETGKMIGDVIAEKKTIEIKWEYITESQASTIKSALASGFFSFVLRDYGTTVTITVYRGTISKEHLGYIGDGNYYYKSLSVSVIQQ